MRNLLNTIFVVVIILFFVTFSLSNSQSIQLNFFGILVSPIPISLLILISFLVGIVLGSILDVVERFSLKKEIKKLKNQLDERTHSSEV